jgi:hypothetical protein
MSKKSLTHMPRTAYEDVLQGLVALYKVCKSISTSSTKMVSKKVLWMKYNTCENEFEFWTFKKKCAQDTMISQEPAKREKERQ